VKSSIERLSTQPPHFFIDAWKYIDPVPTKITTQP
jgi:hypothetical protein